MSQGIVIFDMDGTIANLEHRLRFITDQRPKDWEAFFDACDKDLLNDWAWAMASALSSFCYDIVVVSGRPERVQEKTREWLWTNDFPFHEIYCVRKDGDFTADDILKENWLKAYPRRNEIAFVVDDRSRVVEMWRRNGLVCLQCAKGDF